MQIHRVRETPVPAPGVRELLLEALFCVSAEQQLTPKLS
jgi:hypothetical protein